MITWAAWTRPEATAPTRAVAPGDYLNSDRMAGLVLGIDADHGEEQIIGDADRHKQACVDAHVSDLTKVTGWFSIQIVSAGRTG